MSADTDTYIFDAVIAKNDIARELAKPYPSNSVIFSRLQAIEKALPPMAQPSVIDAYNESLNQQ